MQIEIDRPAELSSRPELKEQGDLGERPTAAQTTVTSTREGSEGAKVTDTCSGNEHRQGFPSSCSLGGSKKETLIGLACVTGHKTPD